MATLENLERLVDELTDAPLNDDDAFQGSIIAAQDILVLDDERCAELFDVSRPSVNRWRNGVTAPRRVVRRHVYSVLLAQSESALKAKRKRVSSNGTGGENASGGVFPIVAKAK